MLALFRYNLYPMQYLMLHPMLHHTLHCTLPNFHPSLPSAEMPTFDEPLPSEWKTFETNEFVLLLALNHVSLSPQCIPSYPTPSTATTPPPLLLLPRPLHCYYPAPFTATTPPPSLLLPLPLHCYYPAPSTATTPPPLLLLPLLLHTHTHSPI